MNDNRLRQKAVVIVGGTGGLGLAGARACAASGARVIVVGRASAKVERAVVDLGRDVAAGLVGDAADAETADEAIRACLETFGRFDGLYHVAGGSGRSRGDGPLDEVTDDGWNDTIRLNLTSLFFSNRAAVRQFLRQRSGGSVLNMTSVLGYSPSPRYFATHAYAATKSAVIGLTRTLASYYASRQIRFNAVAPALVDTPMSQRASSDPEIMRYIRSKQPLDGGRTGQPADLDGAVVFFLSDESRFVTGQVLAVDGGWSVTEGQHPAES